MADNQIFTTALAKKLTPLVAQGCLYNIALQPFVHKGYSKRYFKKQFFGLLCTTTVQLYSGFLNGGCKTASFLKILEGKTLRVFGNPRHLEKSPI